MNIHVDITPVTERGFTRPHIVIQSDDEDVRGRVDVDFYELFRRCGVPSDAALDLLLIASAVYAIDKLVPRGGAQDCWTRALNVVMPVQGHGIWNAAAERISKCLSFLTGDLWTISFEERDSSSALYSRKYICQAPARAGAIPSVRAVCLFSGGADSLVGAIDLLEERSDEGVCLVGHYDSEMPGPKSDQRRLYADLAPAYPSRTTLLQIRAGHSGKAAEITLRSRSLLFIALGLYAAAGYRDVQRLYIPENGTISLNVPLSPSRRGSCSTRTVHPQFVGLLKDLLPRLGLTTEIVNPLANKTKGEVLHGCKNQTLIQSMVLRSVSCAKRGHKRNWRDRSASSCGFCMPCIYRRAALYSVGLDSEKYGLDVCSGEVDPHRGGGVGNDLRAMLGFLHRSPSRTEIGRRLLANSRVRGRDLESDAVLIERAMAEVRALFRDKGSRAVRLRAGIED